MINLFVSYYKASTPERQAEIDRCLHRNLANENIGRIHVATSVALPEDIQGVHIIPYGNKPTYKDFFTWINSRTIKGDINIIANADIFFDGTAAFFNTLKENDCFALSRWEVDEDFFPIPHQVQVHGDSQDVWAFRGKIRPVGKCDFPLGKMGCDNRIAYELDKAGYNITNPSKTIRAWHAHASNVRDYDINVRNENTVVPPPYKTIPVTAL